MATPCIGHTQKVLKGRINLYEIRISRGPIHGWPLETGCMQVKKLFSVITWCYGARIKVLWCNWFHRFRGFIGFVVSIVLWFHKFRGFIGLVVSMVSWFHRFCGVNGFIGFLVSVVSRFHRFRFVNGFMVS